MDYKMFKCGDCKSFLAKYCKKYDEVTDADSLVRCVGFELNRRKKKSSRWPVSVTICGLDIVVSGRNIHIDESYKTTKRDEMKVVLRTLRDYFDERCITVDNPLMYRSDSSMINEWVAHNNAYKLGYKRERTGSVDLNYPQKWYMNVVYFLCSIIAL